MNEKGRPTPVIDSLGVRLPSLFFVTLVFFVAI